MKKASILLLVIGLALHGVGVALAQEITLDERYEDDVLVFQYPTEWVVTSKEDGSLNILNTDTQIEDTFDLPTGVLSIDISTPETEGRNEHIAENIDYYMGAYAGIWLGVASMFAGFANEEFEYDLGLPESLTIGEHAVWMVKVKDVLDRQIMAIDFGDGNIIVLIAAAPLGEIEQYTEVIQAIAESIEYSPQ